MATKNLNERIDNMARWAAGVNDTLELLREKMLPSYAEADQLSAEVGGLSAKYADANGLIQSSEQQIADHKHRLAVLRDEMDIIEASAMLEVSSMVDDDGKLRYSNAKAREAAQTIVLSNNTRYQELLTQQREAELDIASTSAIRDAADRSWSEYYRVNAALVARLEYFTARLSGNKQKES